MSIQARYSGYCLECGERWQPGDLIRYGGTDGFHAHPVWQHAQCPDVPDPLPVTRRVQALHHAQPEGETHE